MVAAVWGALTVTMVVTGIDRLAVDIYLTLGIVCTTGTVIGEWERARGGPLGWARIAGVLGASAGTLGLAGLLLAWTPGEWVGKCITWGIVAAGVAALEVVARRKAAGAAQVS